MSRFFMYIASAVLCFSVVNTNNANKALKFYQEKNYHEAQELIDQDIRNIAAMSDMTHFRRVLNKIMIPRVVATPNHSIVNQFIKTEMTGLGWNVTEDAFDDTAPDFGTLRFKNIIATLNPNADRYLVLACHYDSKYTREHVFVGATDSAVPCAMMINLAKVMGPKLQNLKQSKLSLMFIFFDGEEAFREWGPKDSIYGARHLAKKWQAMSYKDGANHLQRMDVLVLLDLLGAPDPVFYSYFQSTEKWYVRLASAERRLAGLDQLAGYTKGSADQTYFRLSSSRSYVEDDHIPFLRRNVDCLHIIPSPFPDVWHTEADNGSALDYNTIENLNKIMRVFVTEYLHTQA
ncbi:glutaminyl-peptide cyclotransferase [Leguminivora glycinivorella]|uniref:glutaminyl-peptide cyclotransferase n=1 Tax=Leguminivora glycinivorella TaxID=1035111 RepID=UPI00200FA6CA|nr:glutaminyl-peptide cyclotransferase [Leguminivora glycinivorella]